MPIHNALFIGLPKSQISKINDAISKGKGSYSDNWSMAYIPGKGNRLKMFHVSHKALGNHLQGCSSSLHVIALKPPDKQEQRYLNENVKPYFRFRWFDMRYYSLLKANGFEQFIEVVNGVLNEEELWANAIMPQNAMNPLLLPESSFAPRGFGNLWEQARSYGVERINAAKSTLNKFVRLHIMRREGRGRLWSDVKDRDFDWSGERHGKAPFPFNWKYSYSIEDGFHYDVMSSGGFSFEIKDCKSKSYRVKQGEHVNMCPHGNVRT